MITHTNELEKLVNEGTTYWDCFKGSNLRRTEIACFAYIAQVFCVSVLATLRNRHAFQELTNTRGFGSVETLSTSWNAVGWTLQSRLTSDLAQQV